LEGDALEVVQAFNREESWWGSYGAVIQAAKQQLEGIQEWKMKHVPRGANGEAHKLSKLALSLANEQLWETDFPECIVPRESAL
jgi:hypothetical protein